MAAVNPPFVIKGAPSPEEHSAATFRQLVQSTMGSPWSSSAFAGGVATYAGGGGHGIAGATDFLVTQNGTPNMSVNVAGGMAFIRGTEAAAQGCYNVYNDAETNVVISAAHGSLGRKDLIVLKVEDDDYSGTAAAWSMAVVTGTPAASPADPTPPANSLVIARVTVGAAVSTITNANIAMLAPRAAALGGCVVCTAATRPTGAALYEGLDIYETDTNLHLTYDGSTWVTTANLGAWTTWTPVFNQAGAKATTAVDSKYLKIGRTVFIRADCTNTGTGTTGNAVVISGLPFAPASSNQKMGECVIGLAGAEYHAAVVRNGANNELIFSTTSYGSFVGVTPAGALTNGDRFWWSGVYETAA